MAGSEFPFEDGYVITAEGQNNAHYLTETKSFKIIAKNHIRTLFDRVGVYSADETDVWGEAYVDSNGRNDSVDIGATTATFDTNKYESLTESAYIIIEATSVNTSAFSLNNCFNT
jgi:hypothetical protein